MGVSVEGKICLARYGKIYRGNKVHNCQDRGAIGVIMYTDPEQVGSNRNRNNSNSSFNNNSSSSRKSSSCNSSNNNSSRSCRNRLPYNSRVFIYKYAVSDCFGKKISHKIYFLKFVQVAVRGTSPADVYPNTFFLPGSGVQRGSTYIGEGDPLSPLWPSVENAYRIDPEDQPGLPRIPAQPIGYDDARFGIYCSKKYLLSNIQETEIYFF